MTGRRRIAALLVSVAALAGCASGAAADLAGGVPAGSSGGASAPSSTARQDLAPASAHSDLPTMTVAQLPPEGVGTLELIAEGGPFPYSQDGATFQNREGILPSEPAGFYREYTVITPGEDDRGARRIVAGGDGCRFYTSDHYASFREVVAR